MNASVKHISTKEAVGCRLAHSFTITGIKYRKGLLITEDIMANLLVSDINELWVFNPDIHWVDENVVADRLAGYIDTQLADIGFRKQSRQGRVDWFTHKAYRLDFAEHILTAVNSIDDAITLMSIDTDLLGKENRFLALKVIPLLLEWDRVNNWLNAVKQLPLTQLIASYQAVTAAKVAVIMTTLPGVTNKLLDKTRRTAEQAFVDYPYQLDFYIANHNVAELSQTLQHLQEQADCVLIYSASTTVTKGDIIPQSIECVGGELLRAGLPIEPGNLCLVANIGTMLVLNLPGSARSIMHPKIKQMILTSCNNEPLTKTKLDSLGSGGLRHYRLPRDDKKPRQRLLLLAAGQSSRYESGHKLLHLKSDTTLLYRTLDNIPDYIFDTIHVVISADSPYIVEFEEALASYANPRVSALVISTTAGMGDSISRAIRSLPNDTDWIWIQPADMPAISEATYMLLSNEASLASNEQKIIQSTYRGKPGHPVGFHSSLKPTLLSLSGDTGARSVIDAEKLALNQLAVTDANVIFDIDTETTYDQYLKHKL